MDKAGSLQECFSQCADCACVTALEELRAQLRAHFKLDVRKHYSLMVADAAAGTALAKAKGG
jgi:hypothetical protein